MALRAYRHRCGLDLLTRKTTENLGRLDSIFSSSPLM
jgi:hypothetical protein